MCGPRALFVAGRAVSAARPRARPRCVRSSRTPRDPASLRSDATTERARLRHPPRSVVANAPRTCVIGDERDHRTRAAAPPTPFRSSRTPRNPASWARTRRPTAPGCATHRVRSSRTPREPVSLGTNVTTQRVGTGCCATHPVRSSRTPAKHRWWGRMRPPNPLGRRPPRSVVANDTWRRVLGDQRDHRARERRGRRPRRSVVAKGTRARRRGDECDYRMRAGRGLGTRARAACPRGGPRERPRRCAECRCGGLPLRDGQEQQSDQERPRAREGCVSARPQTRSGTQALRR